MDYPQAENVRKIEDIIDIQKDNGNLTRQVAFKAPAESESNVSLNIIKSLQSANSKTKTQGFKKNIKRSISKREYKLSDVISWPSDSDITVLRMKLKLNNFSENIGSLIPGDGQRHPNSSSMINLATLMLQESPSKHSLNVQEYLLPLSSWERGHEGDVEVSEAITEEKWSTQTHSNLDQVINKNHSCIQQNTGQFTLKDSNDFPRNNTKSKVAKFLRLYFCPCCTCLYKMERIRDDQFDSSSKIGELKIF